MLELSKKLLYSCGWCLAKITKPLIWDCKPENLRGLPTWLGPLAAWRLYNESIPMGSIQRRSVSRELGRSWRAQMSHNALSTISYKRKGSLGGEVAKPHSEEHMECRCYCSHFWKLQSSTVSTTIFFIECGMKEKNLK